MTAAPPSAEPSRRLVLWRHGRTAWNAEHRFQGQLDVPLDPIGEAQADRAAAMLAELSPAAIVSSDLVRARRTAQPLADATGLPVTVDPLLRETFGGQWQGLARAEIMATYGDELVRWFAGADLRPGGGETRTEVADRMVLGIGRALDAMTAPGPLVVVSHGGSIRAAIGRLLGLPPQHWAALGVLSNCAWSVLVANSAPAGPPWRLLEYNAGSLPEPAIGDDG